MQTIFNTKFAEDYDRNGQKIKIISRENDYQFKVKFPDGIIKIVYTDEVQKEYDM